MFSMIKSSHLKISIDEYEVQSVNEYLFNNHDKTEFDLCFFIIDAVIYH